MSCGTRKPQESEWAKTLLGEFALDGCLDDLRQIAVDLGARPYRVFLVRTRWSGEERGEGVETVISEEELLPVPKVEAMSPINRSLMDGGIDEVGGLQITEISPRYTEQQLLGYSSLGQQVPQNETFSWEITLMRGDDEVHTRRRFLVQGTPSYQAEELQWSVRLTRAGSDRTDDGSPG